MSSILEKNYFELTMSYTSELKFVDSDPWYNFTYVFIYYLFIYLFIYIHSFIHLFIYSLFIYLFCYSVTSYLSKVLT